MTTYESVQLLSKESAQLADSIRGFGLVGPNLFFLFFLFNPFDFGITLLFT